MTSPHEIRIATALGRALRQSDPDALRGLVSLTRIETYAPDSCLFECGAEADHFLVIESGEVDLTMPVAGLSERRGITIERVRENTILGWSAITNPFHFTLSAWAVGPVSALALQAGSLTNWCNANPEYGLALYREVAHVIGGRLGSMAQTLAGEIAHTVRQKRHGSYT